MNYPRIFLKQNLVDVKEVITDYYFPSSEFTIIQLHTYEILTTLISLITITISYYTNCLEI